MASTMSKGNEGKGQVFTIDLIIGLVITLSVLMLFFTYAPLPSDSLAQDTERTSLLMTSGVPPDWNASTVIIPGLLSNDRFNQTKIMLFANMTKAQQKALLGLQSDFTITFIQNGTQINLCGTCGSNVTNPSDVRVIRRYGILNSTITTMEVHLAQ